MSKYSFHLLISYKKENPLKIDYSLTNRSERDAFVGTYGTLMDYDGGPVQIKNENGDAEYIGSYKKRVSEETNPNAWIRVRAGESLTDTTELNYRLPKGSKNYQVEYVGIDLNVTEKHSFVNGKLDSPIHSAKLEVEVVPK